MKRRGALFWTAFLVLLVVAGQLSASGVTPLPGAHAHNDYEHRHPLLDALAHGFCSVEADIHLVDDALLVAHDRAQVQSHRTLEALYLNPLRERVRRNRGTVYPGGPEFLLLIDVKSEAHATYVRLRQVLSCYTDILTEFRPGSVRRRAVTVILSGNRAIEMVARDPVRYLGVDGRLEDLDRQVDPHLMPLVSDAWLRHFRWFGSGEMPVAERMRLVTLVRKARERGVKLRFWATPETPGCWRVLRDAGVDLISTDQLSRLRDFLLGRVPESVRETARTGRISGCCSLDFLSSL
ncbi:MAG: phosphatidylinositol-specific phospholipase C/glycerophosphodiester phosphodiesterase family protein [Chloroherpetonaceae bacterium]|nr:phosphatidylinositol-specific phospholipase C/glycerophosphodiester phosphodiesterase family protein [Chthonomonadaceae bacterium]MDW8207504.1 phosphatidylinositol-specific phospholipase C/glycerophosphodiester phosphodiesterase family protein [Chloroherpetonaceae bacterium]